MWNVGSDQQLSVCVCGGGGGGDGVVMKIE